MGLDKVAALLVHVRFAETVVVKLRCAFVLPTPPIVVPVQLTERSALIVHTGSAEPCL